MKRQSILGLLVVLLGGCTAPAPTSQRLVTHSAATDAAGTLLVVDVCLSYSPLDTDDYFVIGNAKRGASALETATMRFLDATAVRVRTNVVPFVCGALHDQENTPKRVAEEIDTPVALRPQPVWVAPELVDHAEYVGALQILATHAFRNSLATYAGGAAQEVQLDLEPVRRASALVAQKTGRSSLLYVGVTGRSLSSGKAVAFGAARVVAGTALSLAVGPVFTTPTTNYYAVFVPGGPVDSRQMVAGLFDLKRGELVRSRVVHGGGDPMKPDVLSHRQALNLLLSNMVLTAAPQ